MFPNAFWPQRYFPQRYWPKGADGPVPPVPPVETIGSGGQLPIAPGSENGNGCVQC